jgi:hypothetical protein
MTCRFIKIYVLLLCGIFTAATFAQNSNSTIKGTVQDVSGAVVPGATVTLTNVGTNQQLITTSKADGFYTFTNLSPANYKVSVTLPGFAQWVGILTLRVSQDAEINPHLTAASVSTQVTVHDVTPVIDRVNPTLSDVKNATTIETIPVQNRSILNVLAFSPGVVAGNVGGSGGGYTRVNGVPGGSLDYLVDGQTMTNRFTNELQANPQPLPTFQEVKIITTSGDAQYGRPGLVELVTKSGTNNFHGQAFELNQNNIMRAKAAFSGPTVNALNHNEYGGQIGGPVWIPKIYNGRDKTFFFFDYEGIRETSAASATFLLPPAALRGGNLSSLVDSNGNPITIYDPESTSMAGPPFTRTAFPGNIIPTNRLNPTTQKILSYLPAENLNVAYWTGIPNYQPVNQAATFKNTLYTAKVDQLFGPNRLAMRYTYTSSNRNLQKSTYYILNPNVTLSGGHNGAVTFTEVVGPHAINVARAGIQYNHNYTGPKPISPPITTALGLPTYSDTVAWPGFYWYGTYDSYFYGIDRDNPKDYPDQTLNASDTFSYNRGNHQLMFGFEFANYRLTTSEIGQPGGNYNSSGGNYSALQDPAAVAKGTYDQSANDTGSAFADFLLGEGGGLQQNIYPNYHTRQTEYDGFAQDNWRVTQKLTLNLGLRYAYWTPFADSGGAESTFDPSVPGGLVVYTGNGALPQNVPQAVFDSFKAAGLPIESAAQAGYPLSLWNMPKKNFQPRVGFAYQLTDRTVLRGGWGIYQWSMPLQMFQQATRKNPPFSYSAVLGVGELPDGTVPDATAAELEFPHAEAQFGGPQPLNKYMIGDPGYVLNTSNVAISQGSGFGIAPMDPNYKPQSVQEYNLTLAQELPGHVGFQLSYIGNHAYNQFTFDPINYTVPRDNCATSGTTDIAQCTAGKAAFRRAYPVFGTSGGGNQSLYSYNGYSNTNELQAQVEHTVGNGLLLQAYFTWARTLTTSEQPLLGIGSAQTLIPAALTPGYNLNEPLTSGASLSQRLRAVYAPDPTLPTKTFSFNAHYEFPFGKGKRYLGNAHGFTNALVSGYNISPFFLWHSGFYFSPYYTQFGSGFASGASTPGSITSNSGPAINLSPGKTGILPESQRKRTRWFDASVYDPTKGAPYAGQTYTLGTALEGDFRNNIPLNYMTGPGFNELDATVYKLTPLGKGTMLDIEAQIFNVYNHQNLALPNNKGIITQPIKVGPLNQPQPRQVQLQAKFIF